MTEKLDVFDKTTGHVAVAGLPSHLAHLVQDGYGTMPHRADECPTCQGTGENPRAWEEMGNWDSCPRCLGECGEDYADTPLARDGICPDCIGAEMRASVYAEWPYTLLYDNGMGYYDCASVHKSLKDAIQAAAQGWQTDQIVTDDIDCQNVVWHSAPACPRGGGTGKCSPDCTGDGRCLCGGRSCPECGQ